LKYAKITYKKLQLLIEYTTTKISVFLFGIMLVSTLSQVVSRYIFQRPFMWTQELVRFLFIWIIYLGCVLVSKKDEHVRIDFFLLRLPRRIRFIITLLTNILLVLFFLVVIIAGINMIIVNYKVKTPALRVSWMYFYLGITYGFILMLIYKFDHFVRQIMLIWKDKGWRNKNKPDNTNPKLS